MSNTASGLLIAREAEATKGLGRVLLPLGAALYLWARNCIDKSVFRVARLSRERYIFCLDEPSLSRRQQPSPLELALGLHLLVAGDFSVGVLIAYPVTDLNVDWNKLAGFVATAGANSNDLAL
jgi:hypothetical protein